MRVRLQKIELIDEVAIDALSREELAELAKLWRQKITEYQSILFRVKKRFFGKKSEKSADENSKESDSPKMPKPRGETRKKPSDRYPEAKVREDHIIFTQMPKCEICGDQLMQDSGMTEDSEYLDVEAKDFIVVQQKRQKCRCTKCHGSIVTAPTPPRVTPGGSYSDELIVDATLSKYCDLIPMERYCEMAARGGLSNLPPHSLIKTTFKLADFLGPVYQLIKQETLNTPVLLADETPHRMLEGDAKTRWYLWGFSNEKACFFECHDSRSGDISTAVLLESNCDVLLSDAYSGYKKSINEANASRLKSGLLPIQAAYCNAHSRREFLPDGNNLNKSASIDAEFVRENYKMIYKINDETRGLSDVEILAKRKLMRPYFDAIREDALKKIDAYSRNSSIGKAYSYFLKYFDGLTLFLTNASVPIDNNASERLLRSHVVGRKTWYGTHSRDGAAAAAVHFTIVETCKLNKVNPREYYLNVINQLHYKQEIQTPHQFKIYSLGNTE